MATTMRLQVVVVVVVVEVVVVMMMMMIMVMIATMTTLQFVMLSEVCEKGSACVDIRMQQLQGSWEHKHLGKLCGVTKEALGETRNA